MKRWPYQSVSEEDQEALDTAHYSITTCGVMQPFQNDYRSRIFPIFNDWRINKDKVFKLPQKGYACQVKSEDVSAYFFMSAYSVPSCGSMDLAILIENESGAFIALEGETTKRNLSDGVKGFVLPFKKDPVEEAGNIVKMWTVLAQKSLQHKTLEKHLAPLSREVQHDIFKKYIRPVLGKDVFQLCQLNKA